MMHPDDSDRMIQRLILPSRYRCRIRQAGRSSTYWYASRSAASI